MPSADLTCGHSGARAQTCAITGVRAYVSLQVTWQLKVIDCELMCWQGNRSFADVPVSVRWCVVSMRVTMAGVYSACHWKGHCTHVVPAAQSQKPAAWEPVRALYRVLICWLERECDNEIEEEIWRGRLVRRIRGWKVRYESQLLLFLTLPTGEKREHVVACPGKPVEHVCVQA